MLIILFRSVDFVNYERNNFFQEPLTEEDIFKIVSTHQESDESDESVDTDTTESK